MIIIDIMIMIMKMIMTSTSTAVKESKRHPSQQADYARRISFIQFILFLFVYLPVGGRAT